ncbi:FAD binding domain-containing protein [Actinomadura macra]|uniref:FAD binding domain-containing protein n=1 Tax=Actinomadura macra TaxID=46164 RepID=UPI0008355A40|nr:xanthine dehydrogenase family protein subunit M [Actinomadura macra]
MKAAPFAYLRPGSLDEAVELVAEVGDDDGKILAGGQSLLPVLNLRLAHPAVLIDIAGLGELRAIEPHGTGGGLTVGAMATHRVLERGSSPALAGFAPLSRVAELIGHLPIRTRGTIGGSLAHADSAAEWPLVALVLDCTIHALSRRGVRGIDANDFFEGPFSTALEPDEILTGIHFPRPPHTLNVVEFARRKGDFAIVAAATVLGRRADRCEHARIAVGGVASTPVRIPEAEKVLEGCPLSDVHPAVLEAAYVCGETVDPPSDVHASSAYRKRLVRVLVERALLRSHHDLEGTPS